MADRTRAGRADRYDKTFIAEYGLGDAGANDALLAGLVALNDRDVGVADFIFHTFAKLGLVLSPMTQQILQRNAGYPYPRPDEDLRRAMLSEYLGLGRLRADSVTSRRGPGGTP